MTLPKRIFYTLEEAAKRWKKSEDELLQWAATGALKLAFYQVKLVNVLAVIDSFTDEQREGSLHGEYLYITEDYIHEILAGHTVKCHIVITTKDISAYKGATIKKGETVFIDLGNPTELVCPTISNDDLVVLYEDLINMEAKYPELTDLNQSLNPEKQECTGQEAEAAKGKLLIGWKAIAEYMDCHPSTAKRRAKGTKWLRYSPEGKPTAMSADIDRIMTSGKKKN